MVDEDSRPRHIVFDPKAFISQPYRQCPGCRAEASFGVIRIQPWQYVRRCKECLYSKSFLLPELRKKVLYLDQFAISNMMKSQNPNIGSRKSEAEDFWRKLFRVVNRLCKLQLLVCPDSKFHREESRVSPFPLELQQMYKLLSGGVTLHPRQYIEILQLHEHVQRWVTGRESQAWQFELKTITSGEINGWQDRFTISTEGVNADQWAEEIRRSRDAVHDRFVERFERWRRERKDFWYWFRDEARVYSTILDFPIRYYQRLQIVRDGLAKAGIAAEDLGPRTVEYLMSDAMERLPFNRISAMLTAAIAQEATLGRKRPPTRGIMNDIGLISAYLPYLDSMFIDKECHRYLMEPPLRDELDYGCRVFSLNTKDALFSYLREIETSASSEHLATVKGVYGDEWGKPYESLYADPEHPSPTENSIPPSS